MAEVTPPAAMDRLTSPLTAPPLSPLPPAVLTAVMSPPPPLETASQVTAPAASITRIALPAVQVPATRRCIEASMSALLKLASTTLEPLTEFCDGGLRRDRVGRAADRNQGRSTVPFTVICR
jgi:hypothetical protein